MTNRERFELAKQQLMAEIQGDVRKSAIKLHSKIQLKSPVDTGALRRSWVFTEETPFSFTIATDKPYAKVLECGLYPNPAKTGYKTVDGYSRQAPAGFVRISIEEVINEFK